MRIHGDKTLQRRMDVPHQDDYRKYKPDLQDDFQHICGYCGKHECLSHRGMEIDHFVPKKVDQDRQRDYQNLVYSCFCCNRKKGKKWPTKDKHLQHNGTQGFVDPATPEYDEHLGRNENGSIVFNTAVGRYMYETFRFDLRATDIIWKATIYHELVEQLMRNINAAPPQEQERYIKASVELFKMRQYLFDCGE